MMVQDWSIITLEALQIAWKGFLLFLPRLIGSLVVLVIGWFLAVGLGKLIAEILKQLRFNKIFDRAGWREALQKAELKVNPSEFIGAIAKWILIIVFLLASVEILGFVQFADFLQRVVTWLPNLIVASAIFIVTVIVTDILEKVIKASVEKMEVGYAGFLGVAIRWTIYIFAGLAILLQLGVTPTIIDTLIKGVVGMITLSFGLAFGLGGKDAAAKFITEIKEKISEK
ncbi:MAG: mechanosensitive ion channel family protein [Candidatus Nealsonbacteria bacterium]